MEIKSKTSEFIQQLRREGRYSFTIPELENTIKKPIKSLRKDLDRLNKKGEIQCIRREFYTIIPVEFQNMGMLPAIYYVDDLMAFLQKPYYISLYSAAMFHGAAHQQPQEFFILTSSPGFRDIKNEKLVINFSEKKHFPKYGIEEKKSEVGYFKISNKELTFLDLIYFAPKTGGLNRNITILKELSDEINSVKLNESMKNDFPISVYQRAGYIAENVFENEKLASVFEKKIMKTKTKTILLAPSINKKGVKNEKWNVIINTELESDL